LDRLKFCGALKHVEKCNDAENEARRARPIDGFRWSRDCRRRRRVAFISAALASASKRRGLGSGLPLN
jgi:hypothetical protein